MALMWLAGHCSQVENADPVPEGIIDLVRLSQDFGPQPDGPIPAMR